MSYMGIFRATGMNISPWWMKESSHHHSGLNFLNHILEYTRTKSSRNAINLDILASYCSCPISRRSTRQAVLSRHSEAISFHQYMLRPHTVAACSPRSRQIRRPKRCSSIPSSVRRLHWQPSLCGLGSVYRPRQPGRSQWGLVDVCGDGDTCFQLLVGLWRLAISGFVWIARRLCV